MSDDDFATKFSGISIPSVLTDYNISIQEITFKLKEGDSKLKLKEEEKKKLQLEEDLKIQQQKQILEAQNAEKNANELLLQKTIENEKDDELITNYLSNIQKTEANIGLYPPVLNDEASWSRNYKILTKTQKTFAVLYFFRYFKLFDTKIIPLNHIRTETQLDYYFSNEYDGFLLDIQNLKPKKLVSETLKNWTIEKMITFEPIAVKLMEKYKSLINDKDVFIAFGEIIDTLLSRENFLLNNKSVDYVKSILKGVTINQVAQLNQEISVNFLDFLINYLDLENVDLEIELKYLYNGFNQTFRNFLFLIGTKLEQKDLISDAFIHILDIAKWIDYFTLIKSKLYSNEILAKLQEFEDFVLNSGQENLYQKFLELLLVNNILSEKSLQMVIKSVLDHETLNFLAYFLLSKSFNKSLAVLLASDDGKYFGLCLIIVCTIPI